MYLSATINSKGNIKVCGYTPSVFRHFFAKRHNVFGFLSASLDKEKPLNWANSQGKKRNC